MLRFVVDWLSNSNPLPAIEAPPPIARDASAIVEYLKRQDEAERAPTPRELGIRFHQSEFARLFEAVEGWPTVEFITARGLPIDGVDDLPKGADGGIDVIVRILTPTEHGARIVAGRLRKMLVEQAYG